MKVYCPNCGQANETGPGARVMCTACTAVFDAPPEAGAPPPEPPAPPAPSPDQSWSQPSAPPQTYANPDPQFAPTAGYGTQPTPSWQPSAPSHGSPVTMGAAPVTNTLAIVSLVAGLVCCLPLVSNLTAIITGMMAISQINANPGTQKGKGLAVTGIVLGSLGIVVSILGIIGNIASAAAQ